MIISRNEDFGKIELKIDFGQKRDVIFCLKGSTYSVSTKGLPDETHSRLSKMWQQYATRDTLKVAALLKFNQVENLARSCKDLSEFLQRFNEHEIYRMPLSIAEVTDTAHTQAEKPALLKRTQAAIDKATKTLENAYARAAKKKAHASKPQKIEPGKNREVKTRYDYPEGMTADEKKKFRAAARAKAKKG